MPFAEVDTQTDFPAQERAILQLWDRTAAFETLREQNRGKPRWSFLDGPITANNPMGVHHAWGRTYKDCYQRFFAMTGHELRYQNGFDCQGLWVEVEVEKELSEELGRRLTKRDIETLVPGDREASIALFVNRCKQRVDRFARRQTEQSIRLGYWMDWDRTDADWAKPPGERKSYFTMSDENNYTIWGFLKKCHQRGLVYRGYDAMPWCPRCAVGLSQMEMHEGYHMVAHRAVFVRFPLKDRPNENLLVWTTTPWTLSSNVAAAVNPALTYLKVKLKDQVYYVAKGAYTSKRLEEQFKRKEWVDGVPKLKTLEQLFKEKAGKDGVEVVGEIAGKEMVGWTYHGPYDELEAQDQPGGYPEEVAKAAHRQGWASTAGARELHRVIAWGDSGEKKGVGDTEGTGIVHIAPGAGKEDFALGKREKLPALAPLDDMGIFLPAYGELSGKSAVDPATTDTILDQLKNKDVLFAVEKYPHSYPHCWRCKTELLFRLVDEWFISMSWRDEIMKVCHDVRWIPDFGLQRELDWLMNMGDWMISKKRFWGLALPIWVDEETNDFEVIGSYAELKERAVEGWTEFDGNSPHRPWVDHVKIRNPKTGNLMSRVPDVGNPWLDAGIVPFSTMKYNTDRAYWSAWFPADFVTESFPGQFRNWFYALLAMSTMLAEKAPFKTLLGHALVRDQYGKEMHKSAGNSIPFEGAADEGYELADGKGNRTRYPAMSADLIRWMYCRHTPSQNINFGPGPADEVRSRFTLKLWNTYSFFTTYARLNNFDPASPPVPVGERPDLDRWILSDLQRLIRLARTEYEKFNVQAFCLEAEKFVDDRLSNWYVRRSRRRFWENDDSKDMVSAHQTLHTVLSTLAKLVAPVMPFIAEAMHQNLVNLGDESRGSVHLTGFPDADPTLIDAELSEDMNAVLGLVSLGSAARNSVKIKVRQPLAEFVVSPGFDGERRAVERYGDLLMDELNVQSVRVHDQSKGPLLDLDVKPNVKVLGQKHGARLKLYQDAIAQEDVAVLLAGAGAGRPFRVPSPEGLLELVGDDLIVMPQVPAGFAGLVDRGTEVLLDVRISEDLALRGMAREAVRHIQQLRKTARLRKEDRISLCLATESDSLARAIDAHREYIARETLTVRWGDQPNGEPHTATAAVDGQPLTITLAKA